MSRQNVYNPLLKLLQHQKLKDSKKGNQKLFSPASSKQQFFKLKRNNTKKSFTSPASQHMKLNFSVDRKDSDDFSKHQWDAVNISQQIYLNTSTDDDVKTTSTKSYDTHEDANIYTSSNTKKKKQVGFVETKKLTNESGSINDKILNPFKMDHQNQCESIKGQFSHFFEEEIAQKKQKRNKHDMLLKFKDYIKKKFLLPLKIKHFQLQPKLLGQGTYSKVYRAIHKKTGMICAIKVIEKQLIISQNLLDNLIEQIKIMSIYEHPNIAKLWGFFDEGSKFYMIMEYCTDSYLYSLIKNFENHKKNGKMTYQKKVDYIKQLCLAIEYLHQNSIMHRDIKPQNILLTMQDTVKLSDFGWARIIHNPAEQLRKTLCGTPLYLAPQQIKQCQYSKSVDLWAIGILTYELLTGKIPFTIESIQDLHKIVNEDVSFDEISCFPYAKEFVSLLLEKDGQKRHQIHRISDHQFLNIQSGLNQQTFMYQLQFGKFI